MDADRQSLIDEIEQLRNENAQLKEAVAKLTKQVGQLLAEVEKLSKALEEARRAGKRQAAPFGKKPKPGQAKKPGRKRGKDYGNHTRRAIPDEQQVTERYRVPLPDGCPHCQGTDIDPGNPMIQYQIEIPAEPVYRKFTIETGCCQNCGKTVQGRHESQTSDAAGAAAVQFGPRLHAAMAWLNKRLGLSHGKIRQLFAELFDISLSRSTAARSCHRTAKRCAAAHQQVRKDVRGSPQVVPDETGWRVGGGKAWLHEFAGLTEVAYVIDPTRSRDPAEQLLGLDWTGRLVHDGWSPYNAFTRATHQQCTAHLINRCNEMLETAAAAAARFPAAVKNLLQRGLSLRDRYQSEEITKHGMSVMAGRLSKELLWLVGVQKTNPENERFAQFLFQHHDEVFSYLRYPGMDATNWRGEQAIRFGVVNRKVWGGNRTWNGARTQSTLMSVIQTCAMRSLSPIHFLIDAITSPEPILIPQPVR